MGRGGCVKWKAGRIGEDDGRRALSLPAMPSNRSTGQARLMPGTEMAQGIGVISHSEVTEKKITETWKVGDERKKKRKKKERKITQALYHISVWEEGNTLIINKKNSFQEVKGLMSSSEQYYLFI